MKRLFSSTLWSGVAERLVQPRPSPSERLAEQKVRAMGGAQDSVAYGWQSTGAALEAAERQLAATIEGVDRVSMANGPWQQSRWRGR